MKIERQKMLTVLNGMQTNKSKIESLNNVNFKEKIIYQTNNDIMIYSEIFIKKFSFGCLNSTSQKKNQAISRRDKH